MARPSSFLSTSNVNLVPLENLLESHQTPLNSQYNAISSDDYRYWSHLGNIPSYSRSRESNEHMGADNTPPSVALHITYTHILNNMLYNKRYDTSITLEMLKNQPSRILNYLRPLRNISLQQALPLSLPALSRVIDDVAIDVSQHSRPKDGADAILEEFEEESRRLCALLSIAMCVPAPQGSDPSQGLRKGIRSGSEVTATEGTSSITGGGKGHLLVMIKDTSTSVAHHISERQTASSVEWQSHPTVTFAALLGMMPPLPPALVKYVSFPLSPYTIRSTPYNAAAAHMSYNGSDIIMGDSIGRVVYPLGRGLRSLWPIASENTAESPKPHGEKRWRSMSNNSGSSNSLNREVPNHTNDCLGGMYLPGEENNNNVHCMPFSNFASNTTHQWESFNMYQDPIARALVMLLVTIEEQSWNAKDETGNGVSEGAPGKRNTDEMTHTCMLTPISTLEVVEETLRPFYRNSGNGGNSKNNNKRSLFQRKTVLVVQNIDVASPAVIEVLHRAIVNGVVIIEEFNEEDRNDQEKKYSDLTSPNSETESKSIKHNDDDDSLQCSHTSLNHVYRSEEDSSFGHNHSSRNNSSFRKGPQTLKMYPIPSITILATMASNGFSTALPAALRESFLLSMVVSTASLSLGLEKSNLPSTTRNYTDTSSQSSSREQLHHRSEPTADESAPMDRLVELLYTPRSLGGILEDPRYVKCPQEVSNSLRVSLSSLQYRLVSLTTTVITKHVHRHKWIMQAVKVAAYLYGPSTTAAMEPKRRTRRKNTRELNEGRLMNRHPTLCQLSGGPQCRDRLLQYAVLSDRDRRIGRDKLLHLGLLAGTLSLSSSMVGGSAIIDPSFRAIALHGRHPATVSYASAQCLLPHLLAHHIEVDELEYNIYCTTSGGLVRNCSGNSMAQLLSAGGYEQLQAGRQYSNSEQEASIRYIPKERSCIGPRSSVNLTAANLLLKCLTCCAIVVNRSTRGFTSHNNPQKPLDSKYSQKDYGTNHDNMSNNDTIHPSLAEELHEIIAKHPVNVLVEFRRLLEIFVVQREVSMGGEGNTYSSYNPFYHLCATPSAGWDALVVHLDSMRRGYTQRTWTSENDFYGAAHDPLLSEKRYRHMNPVAFFLGGDTKYILPHPITTLPSAGYEEGFWKDQLRKIQEHYHHTVTTPNDSQHCSKSRSFGDHVTIGSHNTSITLISASEEKSFYISQWESALLACWTTALYALRALQPSNIPYHTCLAWVQEVFMDLETR